MPFTHAVTYVVVVIALFIGAFSLSSCAQESGATVETQVTGTTIHFAVGGMHCEGCAGLIRSTISRIDGVQQCAVSYEDESAEVVIADGDEEAAIEKIIEAVTKDGFTIERTGT